MTDPVPEPPALLADCAAFYLCMARAFAVPDRPQALTLLAADLPADLTELATSCVLPIAPALADYRRAIGAVADQPALLRLYARLFLVPGVAHPNLNTGSYLDGGHAGGSVAALADIYRRCGLEPDPGLRDLPDHLSVQLEFLAWLLMGAADAAGGSDPDRLPPVSAGVFLASFVAHWVGPFRADLAAAGPRFGLAANPYLALACILECAVQTDLARLAATGQPDVGRSDAAHRPDLDPEIARLRSQVAGQPIGEQDLAIIRARLQAAGLPSGHVAIPVDERDRVMGLASMTPPAPPSHRQGGPGNG